MKPTDPNYLGRYMMPFVPDEERRAEWKRKSPNKIHLYDPKKIEKKRTKGKEVRKDELRVLQQIVHVYEHTYDDFEFNSLRIIDHYKKYYGSNSLRPYTVGQMIQFQVVPDGQIFELTLFKFLQNYSMLSIPVIGLADLSDWSPYVPHVFSAESWYQRINQYIIACCDKVNMRCIDECIALAKYVMNQFIYRVGDRAALSISNNEFIEVMKRNPEAFKSITCKFDIPKHAAPSEVEKITMDRTKALLAFIGQQTDLSISTYARNGLFNKIQFREYAVHITHKPHLDGTTVPYTYPTNMFMGIKDPRAAMVDSYGGRKAENTKLNVSDAGTLERAFCMLMSPVKDVDVDYECDSRHFRKRYISDISDLEKIEGRVIVDDPNAEELSYYIAGVKDTDLIGKVVFMKTPITCTHPKRSKGVICSACYGKRLAGLNRDIHIGRVSAVDNADEIEQKLLSAKHALETNTNEIEFDEGFEQYFTHEYGQIMFNSTFLEAVESNSSLMDHLFLEFYPAQMAKCKDGEARRYDRMFHEIVVYDDRDESKLVIAEAHGNPIYLSPEFTTEAFIRKLHYWNKKDPIRVPFNELIDSGVPLISVLFEYTYKNNELVGPLLKLDEILFNCEKIADFKDINDCMDTLMPLFVKGGIHVPDYQMELLISQLITDPNGKPVDWTLDDPAYVFNSINKSIRQFDSPVTSILYRESGAQLAGAGGTFEKYGTSDYDPFLISDKSIYE